MRKTILRAAWVGGALLLLTSTTGFAERGERDDASARRQAMDEWYNETYDQHDNGQRRFRAGHGKPLWTPEYERFMRDAAQRERSRYATTLPQSGTSQSVTDSFAPAVASGTSWTNIGPTRANYAENGGTLNVTDSGRVNEIVTDPANPNTIYVGFSGGGVWKTTDGGATWTAKTETLGSLAVGALELDPNNANTLYLGLGDAFDGTGIGMAKSTDGGDTWSTPVTLGDSSKILDIQIGAGNSTIVLAATDKGLYRSTNSGASFAKVAIATGRAGDPYVWTIAWGGGSNFTLSLEANRAATTGTTDGQIWRSTDNGATWTRASGVADALGVGRITIASAPANRNVQYALAAVPNPSGNDLANIFKTTDGGATWTGVAKSGTTYKSYANTNGESSSLATLLGGQGWYNHAVVVDNANANVAYFGGQLLLAKTSDGGATFRQVSNWLAQFGLPYVHADFHAAHMAANGTLYVGTDGGIFRSTDNATTFTHTLNIGIASHLVYQVGSSTANRNRVIIGLQDNGTRVRESNTSVFNQEIGGDGFGCNVNRANGNLLLGSLYYNRVYKSTDGGLSFSSACSGIAECNNSSTGVFITRIAQYGGDTTGNTVYTFSKSKVYRSTNYAGSWTALGTTGMLASGAQIRNVGVAPTNSNVVGVVTSGGGVSITTNGGTGWTQVGGANLPNHGSSLSYIAFDPLTTTTVYVASVAPDFTKTHLWKSTNGGTTWTAIDGGASGFPNGIPVNSIQPDPTNGQYLYAGTHLGVYRSTDGGATWARFGTGLPLVNVTDLYIAPDASLVRAATFGRAVWELIPAANASPVANFTFTTSNLTATFADASTDSDGTIASRSWNFGDGTTSTATNPTRTYAAGGSYNVTLTVADNAGATNSVTKVVSVTAPANVAPTANFSFVTSGLTASFTDGSTDSDGSIASRAWNFGDGSTSTATNPSRTYAAAGTYNVTLTVTDNGGATHAVTKAATVTSSSCGGTVLCNGVAVTGLAAATGASLNYTMVVPAGASNLKFVISGGTGDADLYVKFGSAPTTTSYDCRPYLGGNAETCNIATAQAGTYYVMLRAYAAFSGVSLTGSYTVAGPSFTNSTVMAIADNTTIDSTIAVTGVTGTAPATLKVPVNITHTYQGDLKIDLIAPNGTTFNLWNRTGAGTDNINQTFTVNASSVTAPNGTWTLRVADQAAGDTGRLNGWGLQF
jgi:PKD repeat protein